ncbi:Uncharacterised protein [Enterobacter cloacae]|nr:Uncharacterised protein [Enterobacter cloacae]
MRWHSAKSLAIGRALQQGATLTTQQQTPIGQHRARPQGAFIAGIQVTPVLPLVVGAQHLPMLGRGVQAAVVVGKQPHQVEVGPLGSWRRLQRLLRPCLAAILGGQHQRPEAYRNALPGIEKVHGEQRPVFFARQALDLPGFPAVGGGQDRAPVTHRPAVPGIHEGHTRQWRG